MDLANARIAQLMIPVKSIERGTAFYKDVLGLPFLFSAPPQMSFFDCGGVRLFLSQADGGGDSESILYFRVEDIRLVHVALASQGVEFRDAPHMIHRHEDGTEEWMTVFNDQEGRPLALIEQVRPAG